MSGAGPRTQQILISLAISAGLTVILGALAVLFPGLGDRIFLRVENAFSRFAGRKTLSIAVVFAAVIGIRLMALPWLHVPVPGIHDEYSYLLMADTFVHGRLANPPHPMWVSFETFHVNWFPTYSSIYPPAQGLALAIGQLSGSPWIGVLLSTGAMCAAILWMLQAWMPARWAFLGASLAALRLGITSYWVNSYWGGAVAATGGALVLGALARVVGRTPRIRDAVLLGLGAAILANSRPYEGFLLSAPAEVWFAWWLMGKTKSAPPLWLRVRKGFAPLAVVLLLTIAFMGYYNWRLTGNALLMPHVLHTRMYGSTGLFLWDRPKPPMKYRNEQFEAFYNGWERTHYDHTWKTLWLVTREKLSRCGTTYFWIGTLLAFPALPFVLCDRKARFLLITFALGAVGVFVVIWSNAHYAAPFTCVVFALSVRAIRYLRVMKFGARPVGTALSRAMVLLLMLDTGTNIARGACDALRWPCDGDPSRAAIASQLSQTPGEHLVMVRYDVHHHNIHDDWVYNGADIDRSKVIWARELDPQQNAKLFAYFKGRKVWLVTPDTDNEYLELYTPPEKEP